MATPEQKAMLIRRTKGEVADRAPLRVEEAAPTPQQVAIDGFAPAAAVKSSNGKHDDAFEGMD